MMDKKLKLKPDPTPEEMGKIRRFLDSVPESEPVNPEKLKTEVRQFLRQFGPIRSRRTPKN